MQSSSRPVAVGLKELIWRKGNERCERSYKQEAQAQQAQAQQQLTEPSTAQIQRINNPFETEGFRQVSSKREEVNNKINDRYLVGQSTQNPFMCGNNYANDIEVQMNFLTPQKN